VAAAATALATHRIRLGTAIVPLGPRTLPTLASAAISVAQVSDQRFVLGVGVSSHAIIEGWHGLPYGRPLERARDSIPVLRAILAGERTDTDLATVKTKGFRIRNSPMLSVPVMLAGLNQRMLETAGELADGAILNYVPTQALGRVIDAVRRGAERAGRDAAPEIVLVAQCEVTDDVAGARARFAHNFASYLTAEVYRKAFRWYGFADEADQAEKAWESRDMDGVRAAITDRMIDELSIIGDADTCRRRIADLTATGVSTVLLYVGGEDPRATLGHFSR
jgi:alkanesulfonate monooxygenase SsuD/methylene tetrahydromethanopterin reductase-like flavin-dependent oxidoreductase (luciferase family)